MRNFLTTLLYLPLVMRVLSAAEEKADALHDYASAPASPGGRRGRLTVQFFPEEDKPR